MFSPLPQLWSPSHQDEKSPILGVKRPRVTFSNNRPHPAPAHREANPAGTATVPGTPSPWVATHTSFSSSLPWHQLPQGEGPPGCSATSFTPRRTYGESDPRKGSGKGAAGDGSPHVQGGDGQEGSCVQGSHQVSWGHNLHVWKGFCHLPLPVLRTKTAADGQGAAGPNIKQGAF